jgi:transcriptional regulator with XRE-family HTH domain
MNPAEQTFFKALGARIADLRKEQGLTQQQLAGRLGIAQQTLAHYEVGRLRMTASLLPELSRLFGVPVDELLGLVSGAGKRGPTPKFQKQLERIARLPRAKQHVLMQMLDGVLAQGGH